MVFRSTLPHGKRHHRRQRNGHASAVSIHAPAWEATGANNFLRGLTIVSIHAPAWEATRSTPTSSPAGAFRSTLPHGKRPTTDGWLTRPSGFDPRSRMGSDLSRSRHRRFCRCFDPRSRMGSDPAQALPARSPHCFDPRSRMGSDCAADAAAAAVEVSIHAPAWGATRIGRCRGSGLRVSIHAPAWEATARAALTTARRSRFDPRSRMGSDADGD